MSLSRVSGFKAFVLIFPIIYSVECSASPYIANLNRATNNPYFKSSESVITKSQICPPDSTGVVVIPHEWDCTKFYICFDRMASEYECLKGMEFDPKSLQCVSISDNGCTGSSKLTTAITTAMPTTTRITPTSSTLKPEICPSNSTNIDVIPHEWDCTMFYVCFNGIATEYQCGDGMEFDPKLLQCVPISDNGCTASNKPTTRKKPPKTTTKKPVPKPTTRTTTRTTTRKYPTSSTERPEEVCFIGIVIVIPHESDCTKFYICFMGILIENQCHDEFEFDHISLECVPISEEGCLASSSTKPQVGIDIRIMLLFIYIWMVWKFN